MLLEIKDLQLRQKDLEKQAADLTQKMNELEHQAALLDKRRDMDIRINRLLLIFALLSLSAWGQTVVQSVNNSGGGGYSITFSSTTVGNLLLLAAGNSTGGNTFTCPANWTQRYNGNPTSSQHGANLLICEYQNNPGGITTVTITSTYAAWIAGMEVSGIVASSPFDQSAQSYTNSPTSPWTSSATATTTQANEFLFGVATNWVSAAPIFTSGASGWTKSSDAIESGYDSEVAIFSQVVTSTGSYSMSTNFSGSPSWLTGGIWTYKSSGGVPQAATPTFSPGVGTYLTSQTVTISSTTSGATICYTTNGNTPTAGTAGTCDSTSGESSLSNGGSITVSNSETVNAIATQSTYSNSAVGSASYTIGASSCSGMTLGQNTALNGFVPFSPYSLSDNITTWDVDPNSATYICTVDNSSPTCGTDLWPHPLFGSEAIYGQYYYVVNSSQPMVNVAINAYDSQSDDPSGAGYLPVPIPPTALVEGGSQCPGADAHTHVIDASNCWDYELYHACYNGTSWSTDQITVWDMLNTEYRPYTWTSTDAAGLSVFHLAVRYDEAAAGTISHAVRATFATSEEAFTLPATHYTTGNPINGWPPMGLRLRLRSSFDITGGGTFDTITQNILKAMQTYGMVMADNGGSGTGLMIDGDQDSRWNDVNLHDYLSTVTLNNFDVVTPSATGAEIITYGPQGSNSVPTGSNPSINSFTASPSTIASGASSLLSWSSTGTSYYVIVPTVGPVRGNSICVSPTSTTTYTIGATNTYGRTTATATVTVSGSGGSGGCGSNPQPNPPTGVAATVN